MTASDSPRRPPPESGGSDPPDRAGAKPEPGSDARPASEPHGGRGPSQVEAPPSEGPSTVGAATARKLGHWAVSTQPRAPDDADTNTGADDHRDVVAHASRIVLALGALGVVYGDLGTSPLYTEQTVFTAHADAAKPTPAGVYGVASLIFWSLTIVVSIKYAGFIMRAHNRGDGGIMALTALVQRRKVAGAAALVVLGIFGAGLFFGDGMVTPAISVVSAVEGLGVATPGLEHAVVPVALVILIVLFMVQRFGTGPVGWLFGPVIVLWFLVIAVLGLSQVIPHPEVLQGLSPSWGVRFMVDHGVAAFLTLGAVVLCVTGAEALYADRGHFGAGPIRLAWFTVVFPAVLLNYLGQGALILHHKQDIINPFYLLVPSGLRIPMVVLATAATVIASQAAITGSFSVARQAVQLGLLPRLNIRHTSELEGQIYVPVINWLLGTGVVALVVGFQHSSKLADIYGVAVTGTFVLNTILFVAVARSLWRTPKWQLGLLATLFLTVEVSFFASNLAKIDHGAWLPLGIGLVVAFVMVTWSKGREIVTANRIAEEGSLADFLAHLHELDPPLHRVPGTAIFLNPNMETTPLALRTEVDRIHALQEHVIIASIDQPSVPHVDPAKRFSVQTLGAEPYCLLCVIVRVGYRDRVDVPAALARAQEQELLAPELDLVHASYLVSRISIVPSRAPGMRRWRKRIFLAMARNAASPIDAFRLPPERTVVMGSQVQV